MRLKITLAYVGTGFSGWQRQPHHPTVQAQVEAAAETVAGRAIPVTGAGRTDAGVHARGQCAHLDVPDRLPPGDWLGALNAHLPETVRVLDCRQVADGFHARHDAAGKLYRYSIDNRPVPSPFRAPFAWHLPRSLNIPAMQEAAHELLGPLDQRAFSTQPEPGRADRPLSSVHVGSCAVDGGSVIFIEVAGRSFLRYAVRGMVGTLAEVGSGKREPATLRQLAEAGDRDAAGPTAPPHGLCLQRVVYPGEVDEPEE